MTKLGYTKIVDLMTPSVGVVVLESGHIGDIVISLKIFYFPLGYKAD